jgi:hypothetical protein
MSDEGWLTRALTRVDRMQGNHRQGYTDLACVKKHTILDMDRVSSLSDPEG